MAIALYLLNNKQNKYTYIYCYYYCYFYFKEFFHPINELR